MPTVIDSLVLELNLDPSRFTAGQREIVDKARKLEEEAKRAGSDAEAMGKKTSEFFLGLKRQALEVLGIFVGGAGVKDFIQNLTTANVQLGLMQTRLNVSGKEISGWQGAARQMGISTQEVNASFEGLNNALRDISITGEVPKGLAWLRNVPGLFTATGQVMPGVVGNMSRLSEVFLSMSDWAREHNVDPAQAVRYFSLIPGMTAGFATMLTKPRADLVAMIMESEKLLHVDDDLIKKSQDFTKETSKLQLALAGAGNVVMSTLYPWLSAAAAKMKDMAAAHPFAGAALYGASQVFGGVGSFAGTVLGVLGVNKAVSAIKGLFGGAAAKAAAAEAGEAVGAAAAEGIGVGLMGSAGTLGAIIAGLTGIGIVAAKATAAIPGFKEEWDRMQPYRDAAGFAEYGVAPAIAPATGGTFAGRPGGGVPSVGEMRAYIRSSAAKRGMNPDYAVSVAEHEGLYAYSKSSSGQSLIPGETSYGPFQLHYGGGSDEGDRFSRTTGLDARDPSTWKAQIDYTLDRVKQIGWAPWHGAPYASVPPGAAAAASFMSTSSTASTAKSLTVSIGEVNVNAPNVKNPNDASADGVKKALDRSMFASSAFLQTP